MSHNVEMPSLGESITEATLLQWLKKEGDRVKVDEPLCELESDKATVDLPSPESGVLHHIKKAGETAHVGEVIARIDPVEADGEPSAKARDPSEEPSAVLSEKAKADKPSAASPKKAESEERAAPSEDAKAAEPAHPSQADTVKAAWKVAQPPAEAPHIPE